MFCSVSNFILLILFYKLYFIPHPTTVFVKAEKLLGNLLSRRGSACWGSVEAVRESKIKQMELQSEEKCFDKDL